MQLPKENLSREAGRRFCQNTCNFCLCSESRPIRLERLKMPLTTVIITIVAVGLVLWLVNRFIPMQGQIKSILNGLVVIVLVLWIANLYGVLDHLRHFRVGR